MRKLGLSLMLSATLLAASAGPALAAGPDPDGNNPWDIASPDCVTNSGAAGRLLVNTNSGKTHCFAL